MQVWIVVTHTGGEDVGVEGVYATKELAEAGLARARAGSGTSWRNPKLYGNVEEHTVQVPVDGHGVPSWYSGEKP
jgi:hypothetical protein